MYTSKVKRGQIKPGPTWINFSPNGSIEILAEIISLLGLGLGQSSE